MKPSHKQRLSAFLISRVKLRMESVASGELKLCLGARRAGLLLFSFEPVLLGLSK